MTIRIIGGKLGGRKLKAPIPPETRPTSDKTRETIFNILAHKLRNDGQSFENQRVLDVFAGTGAMGLEALSRGAEQACFIENSPNTLCSLKQNINDCRMMEQSTVLGIDIMSLKKATNPPWTIAFLDPPYGKNMILPALSVLATQGWINQETLFVCEMDIREDLETSKTIITLDSREFGRFRILFLRMKP